MKKRQSATIQFTTKKQTRVSLLLFARLLVFSAFTFEAAGGFTNLTLEQFTKIRSQDIIK